MREDTKNSERQCRRAQNGRKCDLTQSLQGRYPDKSGKKDQKPGPGAYNLADDKHKGPSCTMSGWTKKKDLLEGPGPGKYNPKSTVWSPVKYSFSGGGRSNSLRRKDQGPGPGSYKQKSMLNTMYGAFSKNEKDKGLAPSGGPGPGNYNSQNGQSIAEMINKRKGPVFSRGSKRPSMANLNSSPGPGSYAPRSSFGNGAPAISMGSRRPDTSPNRFNSPGPGSYGMMSPLLKQKGGFSFGKGT